MTTLAPHRIVERLETLVAAPMGDELAMMDLDTGNYLVLNRIAAAIWDEIAEPIAVVDLVERMVERFDVAPDECRTDVVTLLSELESKGLVHVGEA